MEFIITQPSANISEKSIFPIVGVGASAGGLAAFTQLLQYLPTDIDMAFVLVQHLDPTHKSSLVELLSKATELPVSEIEQNQELIQNHIYIVPENKEVTIKNSTLQLHDRASAQYPNLLINRFFLSLADDQQTNAIGIILSGAGSDGTFGLEAIKAAGGITFAQDKSAEYESMPESAIRASTADFTLSAPDIAKRLKAIRDHHDRVQNQDKHSESNEHEKDYSRILQLLENRTDVAVTSYKTAMLQRRIQRRFAVLNLRTFSEYADYMENNPSECDLLYQDMLINVTSFFRDKPMMELFTEKLLPELINNNAGAAKGNTLRIWVAGCASGEEAYSLAIICHEYLMEHPSDLTVKIFATDINPIAIEQARSGVYPISALENMSQERRDRYFADIGRDNYRIKDSLRQMCIFAVHNLLVDPPFSKIDYVSCCNVMIYLQLPAQQKLLAAFHYALKQEGILTLGPSESIGAARNLFSAYDKKLKVFRRKQVLSPRHFDASSRGFTRPSIEMQSKPHATQSDKYDFKAFANNMLLSQFTAPSVLVDSNFDILEFYGVTSPFLESSSGKASLNLLKMARPGLVLHLRRAFRHVIEKSEPYRGAVNVKLSADGNSRLINLEVLPFNSENYSDAYYLVVFGQEKASDIAHSSPGTSLTSNSVVDATKDSQITMLERELSAEQEETKRISEDHELAVEELQLANEEVRSSNEELQSLNEELETGSEELASTNEELLSMNQTLRASNESLGAARDYAEAIISTVRHPLLVLTPDLKIVTANTSFITTFKVTEKSIIGCYLYDLGNGEWQIPELRKLLMDVSSMNYHFQDYLINHEFQGIGMRALLLDARRIPHEKVPEDFILLAIEDITERRETAVLRDQRDHLLALNKAKQDFINVASHQLRTPATGVKQFVGIILEDYAGPITATQRSYLERATQSNDRMLQIIDELLEVARIDSEKMTVNRISTDLVALTESVLSEQSALFAEHKQHIKFDHGKSSIAVSVDSPKFRMVLENLINNASKYTPDGGTIHVHLDADASNVTFSVKDQGVGISEGDLDLLFKKFSRIHNSLSIGAGGSGLGLYVSKKIIDLHDGTITVSSEPGKGSTFTVILPVDNGIPVETI